VTTHGPEKALSHPGRPPNLRGKLGTWPSTSIRYPEVKVRPEPSPLGEQSKEQAALDRQRSPPRDPNADPPSAGSGNRWALSARGGSGLR